MKQRILSAALALCILLSSQSVAYAWPEDPSQQADVLMEESISGLAARDSTIPTQSEAYEAMIAMKTQYPEGMAWTNDNPNPAYSWNGGQLGGVNIVAVGCVGFAFILSDAAFGSLQARMYASGGFSYEDIKVGDILRVNGDSHTVIVLGVSDTGVVIAEGNYNSTIHWGRTIPKDEVMSTTSHYITRYPEGYVPSDDPTANEIIDSGTLDGGLTWNLTNAGTMTISGSGAMPDFSGAAEQPWYANSSRIWKVVIENGVTNIGSCAFMDCGVLSAEIPSSVTTIGDNAFRGSSIISMAIPNGVETIGQNAFRSCTGLSTVDLPASIGEVGAAAFFECTKMKSAAFAAGSKQVKLGDDLFARCYSLEKVTLPQSIDRISERMFQNCGLLTRAEIPQGAESIGGSAFASCSGLAAVVIPDSVTTIGIAAFSACPLLSDIYFTGTEAQWNSISKIGDTASAVSKATIHYEYVPETKPSDPTTPTPTPTPGTKEPFIDNGTGKTGWEAIKEEAANTSEGNQVNVNMNGASVVPGDVLDSVKGQDVTISFDMGNGIVWYVNGKDVTADHANDVDLTVQVGTSDIPQNIVNNVAGEREAIQLSLAHSGDFGYSAVLKVNVESKNAGLYANLFYYNESARRLEFVTADQIDAEGIAELTFTHASDYAIVIDADVMNKKPGGSSSGGSGSGGNGGSNSSGGSSDGNSSGSSSDGTSSGNGSSGGNSSGSSGGSSSADGSNTQGTGLRSPMTGEFDIATCGSNAAGLRHEGNSLNFIWLLLAGIAGMAMAVTVTCRIQKKENK